MKHTLKITLSTWFIVLVTVLVNSSIASSQEAPLNAIQRFRFVGSMEDGLKVAILLSHFGPSSDAPFVSLIVKEAGSPKVDLIESAGLMGGGEREIKYLEGQLLDRNSEKLKALGFKLGDNVAESAPYYADLSPISQGVTSLFVDTQRNENTTKLSLKQHDMEGCEPAGGLDYQLCKIDGVCNLSTTDMQCITRAISIKHTYRVGGYHWIAIERKVEPFTGLFGVFVEFIGMKL